jgi:hypothetical protein
MSERTLIRKATVITAAKAGEVLTDTDILIANGTIAAVIPLVVRLSRARAEATRTSFRATPETLAGVLP